jgi:hypothetical protein
MLWIQLIHKQLWDSVICGMTLQHSQNMLAIVRKALDRYSPPDPNSDPGAPPKPHRNPDLYLKPLESSPHNKCIPARSSSLYLASSASPNSIRSADIAMAHLTEVALWPSSKSRDPQHVVQAISGSIPEIPYSFLAIESTANGTGNYFHQTWQQAVDGLNNLHPVFIEWFASELYHKDLTVSTQDFVASFSVREQQLWDLGATLQAINWYRHKASSPGMAPKQIQSEYPSSPDEAFQSSGNRVFHPDHVLQCRQDCLRPFWRGDLIAPAPSGPNALVDLSLLETRDPDIPDHNLLLIWNMPSLPHLAFRNRYIITVDIGGPDPHNDPTNILVLDRNDLRFNPRNGKTAVVAEWHGHIPLDLVAWKAAQIAQFYHCGLLVIESNSADAASTRGNHFESILDEIARYYTNLYFRTSPVHLRSGHPKRWGFHTNSSTKPLIINHLAKILRNNAYIERNSLAADEFDSFELKDNGARMEARQGLHDDRVITRAIATYVAHSWPLPPIPKKKPLQLIPSPFSSLSPRSSLFRPSSFRHPIPRARSPAFL